MFISYAIQNALYYIQVLHRICLIAFNGIGITFMGIVLRQNIIAHGWFIMPLLKE